MKTLLSALALALLVHGAQAQVKIEVTDGQPAQVKLQPVQPIPGLAFNNPLVLVGNADVQKELKATPEQVKKINDLAEQHQKALGVKFDIKKIQEANQATKKALGDILTGDQNKRLAQLELQAKGAMAFFDPQITKDLAVTNPQRIQFAKVMQESAKKRGEIFKDALKDGKADFQLIQKKMAELDRAIVADIVKSLTAEQQAKWKGMAGAPFQGVLPAGGFPGVGIPLPPNIKPNPAPPPPAR